MIVLPYPTKFRDGGCAADPIAAVHYKISDWKEYQMKNPTTVQTKEAANLKSIFEVN